MVSLQREEPVAKRMLDLSLSSVGLLLLTPLMAVIAALVKLEDGGSAFYRATRIGRAGRPFHMLKFRSMVTGADRIGGPIAADNDPRVTRVGRVLRKWKLDELPQLVNVLRGEMSLVGPRPEVSEYVALFTTEERAILEVCPGLTDWASLWACRQGALLAEYGDANQAYLALIRPTKLKLQLLYISDGSFRTDCQILALTALRLLGWRGLPARVHALVEQASASPHSPPGIS